MKNTMDWITFKLSGAYLISCERARQINVEGFDPANDDKYVGNELLRAASSYMNWDHGDVGAPLSWPWHPNSFKPRNYVANLVRAGALIAAEIDRFKRQTIAAEKFHAKFAKRKKHCKTRPSRARRVGLYEESPPVSPKIDRWKGAKPELLIKKVKAAAKIVIRQYWSGFAIGNVHCVYYNNDSQQDVNYVCFWLYGKPDNRGVSPTKYVKIHAKVAETWSGEALRGAMFKIIRVFNKKIVLGKV